jgi:FkbM family methyltransferase
MMKIVSKIRELYKAHKHWKKVQRKSDILLSQMKEQLSFYKQFIRPGDLVFDVGANVGDKTAAFLELGARVVAVEPQESCWRVLKKRFREQTHQVTIVTRALAEKEGVISLYVDKSATISSTSNGWIEAVKKSGRFSTHKWDNKVEVETTTLDCLIKKHGKPRFCKIDVEGAELDVLKGLSVPIDCVSFEFVPERIEKTAECIDKLSSVGRYHYNLCFGEAEFFQLSDIISDNEMKNYLMKMEPLLTNYGDIYAFYGNVLNAAPKRG